MTLKPEVLAAMGKLRSLSKRDGVSEANRECVEIIRAELLAMDAEIERLNAECNQHIRQAMENGRDANEADAMLQEVYDTGESLELHDRIRAHLGIAE